MCVVKFGVDRVDVVVGVAVAGRVARLAMVGSRASGGQVFDQYALDLLDDAMTDLADTIGGTYRAVAGSGHRVAATRLCLPDAFAADALRQTVLSAGVQNVEVVADSVATRSTHSRRAHSNTPPPTATRAGWPKRSCP